MKLPFPSKRVPRIIIDKISPRGVVEAAKFLSKYWDSDSPITNILRFEQTPLQQQYNEALVRNRLATGICRKAVAENGEIVSTVISKIIYKDKPKDPTEQEVDKLASMLPKVQTHNALLNKLFEEANLFSKYNVNAYLDLGRTYTKPEFRRMSLSREMNYSVLAEAHQALGIELFVAVAASAYSQKAYTHDKGYSFELIHEIDYNTFKVGDDYPFKNDTIHQSMQLYAMPLPLQSRQANKERREA